jgi:uncharacterized protein (TIGR00251 family)
MILKVKVKTNSKKQDIEKIDDVKYIAHIKSLPENGKANSELIKLFSKFFKGKAKILKGKTSKNKLIKIE